MKTSREIMDSGEWAYAAQYNLHIFFDPEKRVLYMSDSQGSTRLDQLPAVVQNRVAKLSLETTFNFTVANFAEVAGSWTPQSVEILKNLSRLSINNKKYLVV